MDGNTPLVLQQIQNTWPQDAWDLRNDLIAISPFVSQEALRETAESGVLPDAMLFEVCMANPDATQDEDFLYSLANDIPDPLPIYMINMIRDSWATETTRTILEYGLAQASSKRDFYCSVLLNDEKLRDTTNIDSLRIFHTLRDNLSDRYLLADSYIEENDFENAENILDDIVLDFDLDDRKLDEFDNFVELFDLLKNLNDSNRTIFEMDTTQKSDMETIAAENGWAGAKARNILCYVYGLCEDSPIVTDTSSAPKSAELNFYDPEKLLNEAYNKLSVKPNPADNFAKFEWELPLLGGETILRIVDLNGKTIQQHLISDKLGTWMWDTRSVKDGTYLYEINANGKQLANGKLVIQK